MKLSTILRIGGVTLVIVAAYLTTVMRSGPESGDDRRTIRIGHWQLDGSVRVAYDNAIAEYERLHPDVRVEQIPVPETRYGAWMRTQLIGGIPPDLLQLSRFYGATDEVMARYFVSLSPNINSPNPYNAGSPLEGTMWRDTFVDTLESAMSYFSALQAVYGIPTNLITNGRVFYNRELLREVQGHDRFPETFTEFIAVCEKAKTHRLADGRPLAPIAGSNQVIVTLLLSRSFGQQAQQITQRLAEQTNGGFPADDSGIHLALSVLDGSTSWDDPSFVGGVTLLSQLTNEMQPGAIVAKKDAAMTLFVQQRALFFITGAYDYTNMVAADIDFRVGLLEMPGPEEGVFAGNAFGQIGEGSSGPWGVFGLTRTSEHPEDALDFLKFLTSYETNVKLAREVGWLSPLVDAPTPQGLEAFEPVLSGYPAGKSVINWRGLGSGLAYHEFVSTLHLLNSPEDAPIQAVLDHLKAEEPTLRIDVDRQLAKSAQELSERDITTVALNATAQLTEGSDVAWENAFYGLHTRELEYAQAMWRIQRLKQ